MHEGLKNGKNDYKWRFVLNRCTYAFSVEIRMEKCYTWAWLYKYKEEDILGLGIQVI